MVAFWEGWRAMLPPQIAEGGVVLWAILILSVFALALTLWKLWRLSWLGAWRRARARKAVALWRMHEEPQALDFARKGRGAVTRVAEAAMAALSDPRMSISAAREETERTAKIKLAELRSGLRALETIVTIAPLLGLLGTVLGMIDAFQALQETGARADPAALAGGIWEALLTTAAGMAVAIPAGVVLNWFESILDRVRLDMEDIAAQIFSRPCRTALGPYPIAAE